MCVSQSAGNKYKQLTQKFTFFSFVCVCRFFLAAGTYVYVHEDVRKKNLEPVALAGVVVVVQQHHKNLTTTPRGEGDSGRGRWLTVELETSQSLDRTL